MPRQLYENVYQQGFEDYLRNDAERTIVEATLEQGGDRALWLLIFADGRYALEHDYAVEVRPAGAEALVAFQLEPLRAEEFDRERPEDSSFERAIETLWQRFRAGVAELVTR